MCFSTTRATPIRRKSRDGGLAIGVPGTVAGLALAHRKYGSGRLTLAQLIAPAIALARNGFVVEGDLAETLASAKPLLARWPSSAKIFFKDGAILSAGEKLIQTDLANSLEAIARQGARGFYEGQVAERIVKAVQEAGGRMTLDDLKTYRAVERAPVRGTLSRLRHCLHAAALLRRRASHRDAQHPGRVFRARSSPRKARLRRIFWSKA